VLVEQDLDKDRDAQDTLGDDFVRRWRGDDAWVVLTTATGTVASAAINPAVGFDLDLEDLAILGALERLEGQATARTRLLLCGQFDDLFDGGQVGVIAALRSRFAVSLATRLLGRGLGASQGFAGSGTGFALGPEELLLAQAKLALQTVDLFLEES